MAENISCFEIKNFWALNTLAIYFDISKIRVLIQITICRKARIQMVLSKNNRFSAVEAKNYTPRTEKRKKGTSMWNAWVLWVFVLLHASNFIMETEDNSIQRQHYYFPPSSKLELLCQYEITCIVTKSCITDDLGVRDPPLVWFFSVQNVTKKI